MNAHPKNPAQHGLPAEQDVAPARAIYDEALRRGIGQAVELVG